MATFRKRKNKWQAIVRHKDIGTVAKSFRSKTSAMQWAVEQETNLEGETFGKLNPSKVTLDNLLHRYCWEVTVSPKPHMAKTVKRHSFVVLFVPEGRHTKR